MFINRLAIVINWTLKQLDVYSSTKKGYICYNLATRKLVISYDARFLKSECHFQNQGCNENQSQGEKLCDLTPLPTIISNDNVLIEEPQQDEQDTGLEPPTVPY